MEPTTETAAFDSSAIAAQIGELTGTVGVLGTAAIGVVLALAAFGLVIKLVRKSH